MVSVSWIYINPITTTYLLITLQRVLSDLIFENRYRIAVGRVTILIQDLEGAQEYCYHNYNLTYTGDETCPFKILQNTMPFNDIAQKTIIKNITYIVWRDDISYYTLIKHSNSICNVLALEITQTENINVCLEKLSQNISSNEYEKKNDDKNLGKHLKSTKTVRNVANTSPTSYSSSVSKQTSTESNLSHSTTATLYWDKLELHALVFLLSGALILMIIIIISLVYIIWKMCKRFELKQRQHYGYINIYREISTTSDGYLTPKLVQPPHYEELIYSSPDIQANINIRTMSDGYLKSTIVEPHQYEEIIYQPQHSQYYNIPAVSS